MKPRRWWVFALSAALGILAILFWPGLIRELILTPLIFLIETGRIVYHSFDQKILWVGLILLGVVFFGLSLRPRRHLHPQDKQPSAVPLPRVAVWQRRLKDAQRGDYMRWRLAQRLAALIESARAPRAGSSPGDQGAADFADLPPEIRAYLEAAHQWQAVPLRPRRWFSSPPPQPLALPPEQIAAFLEQQLGMEAEPVPADGEFTGGIPHT